MSYIHSEYFNILWVLLTGYRLQSKWSHSCEMIMIECDGPKLRSERSSVQTCLTSVWLQQYAQDFSLEKEREAARGSGRPGRGQCIVRSGSGLLSIELGERTVRKVEGREECFLEIPAILYFYYEIKFLLVTPATSYCHTSQTELTSSPDHCRLILILVDGD